MNVDFSVIGIILGILALFVLGNIGIYIDDKRQWTKGCKVCGCSYDKEPGVTIMGRTSYKCSSCGSLVWLSWDKVTKFNSGKNRCIKRGNRRFFVIK